MKATISEISSGNRYTDGEMRVLLKFSEADQVYREIRLPISKLGLNGIDVGALLDQEIEVTLSVLGK